jgi:hypothetical protein
MQSTLVLNSRDKSVSALVEHLRAHGFWSEATPDRFDRALEQQVKYFQQTHQGPDGRFLAPDGVVGPATWWALLNASGEGQRSHLAPTIPGGLSPRRACVLEVALAEHKKGVHEQPDGSNRGPEVDKYLPPWQRTSRKGPPWCCFFYSWVVRQALGVYPLRTILGGCAEARARAVERNLWIPKTLRAERPLPGDAFVMDHGNGTGHIGFVLRVSPDGATINTVEGNCGNRVKVGVRSFASEEIVGFIDNVPDETSADYERGVLGADLVDSASTR